MRQTWNALDQNVRACVNQFLQLGGQNIDGTLVPGDPFRLDDPRALAELAGAAAVEAAGGATDRAMAALEPFICQLKIAGRFAS